MQGSLSVNIENSSKPTVKDTYADIVQKYKQSKLINWRRFIETPSLLSHIGQLKDQDVLDLACGEGFYTRRMRKMTSGKVYGVDYSENMIRLANYQLGDDQGEIVYIQYDCCLPFNLGRQFDLITPTFLLQNASSEERLEQMIQNMYDHCKPGGRVAGLGGSLTVSPEVLHYSEKYGLTYLVSDDYFKKEGTLYKIHITDQSQDVDITLELYWFHPNTYERLFKKVGFIDFRWVDMKMEGDEANSDYWKEFMDHNPLIMHEAYKPKQ